MNRDEILASLRENPTRSVLVIGAGINGIGTFRDLALQGIDVLMVDRGDFCSGTSAASSHMVHGGIRYLENGEFRLVREAVQERNLLIQNAPHYVDPLPTTFPIFKVFSGLLNAPLKFIGLLDRPAERGAIVIKIGMMFYDAYTGAHRTVPKHVFRSRKTSLQQYPDLNSQIQFTATYFDAAMPSPERICIDLIQDAEASHPMALALNYMPVIGAQEDRVLLRDALSGETVAVQPQIVINAAGPWIDLTNHAMGHETRFIGGTKGSHLVLDHPQLRQALKDEEFFFENKDGRIVLIFPLKDKVMIGTSDLRIEDPDDAQCTEEEVDYFFDMVKHVFPEIELRRDQIVYRFSGVRPLPVSPEGFTGQISRDHSIERVEPGDGTPFPILNLIGGKWTSFRALSSEVADQVLEHLGQARRVSTKNIPIGGGAGFPQTESARQEWLHELNSLSGLPLSRLETLFDRYGTRAQALALYLAEEEDKALQHAPTYSQREILFYIEQEKSLHLTDIALRRTMLAKLGQLTPELIEELAEIGAAALGWNAQQLRSEIKAASLLMEKR